MEIRLSQTCDDLIAIVGRTKAGMFALANDLQLTPIQMFALYAIYKGESTMGRVACALHCDASNVTGIVDRLVSQGLVTRQEDAQDRRAKTVHLTPGGTKIMQEFANRLPAYLGCDQLTDAERITFHAAAAKLTQEYPSS